MTGAEKVSKVADAIEFALDFDIFRDRAEAAARKFLEYSETSGFDICERDTKGPVHAA